MCREFRWDVQDPWGVFKKSVQKKFVLIFGPLVGKAPTSHKSLSARSVPGERVSDKVSPKMRVCEGGSQAKECLWGPSGPGLRSVKKLSRECQKGVLTLRGTLSEHLFETPEAGALRPWKHPSGHLLGHPHFRGHFVGHFPGHFGPSVGCTPKGSYGNTAF